MIVFYGRNGTGVCVKDNIFTKLSLKSINYPFNKNDSQSLLKYETAQSAAANYSLYD